MEYLHVLSRPMVINHDHDIIWTEAYMDSVVSLLLRISVLDGEHTLLSSVIFYYLLLSNFIPSWQQSKCSLSVSLSFKTPPSSSSQTPTLSPSNILAITQNCYKDTHTPYQPTSACPVSLLHFGISSSAPCVANLFTAISCFLFFPPLHLHLQFPSTQEVIILRALQLYFAKLPF